MKINLALIFAGIWILPSCNSNEKSDASDVRNTSAVYVRNTAIEIVNPETGVKIGTRQISDSIFIEPTDKSCLVTNRKWRLNDYDQEGWVNMEHSDSRPMPAYRASYDGNSTSLISENSNINQVLLIDKKNEKLYRNKDKDLEYRLVK